MQSGKIQTIQQVRQSNLQLKHIQKVLQQELCKLWLNKTEGNEKEKTKWFDPKGNKERKKDDNIQRNPS